jgi:hypothetical protein
MSETCWGQKTSSVGNKLSFPMPTQTHIFNNHSSGYGRLSTAHVRSWLVPENLLSKRFGGLAMGLGNEDYIF